MKKVLTMSGISLVAALLMIVSGCEKTEGDYNAVNESNQTFAGSTYDYLKSRPGVFDSLISVIDRLNLADTLKIQNVTLFAVTNEGFQQVVSKYNLSRKIRNRPPVYLNDMAYNFIDSLVTRYIIQGSYIADDFNYIDGKPVTSVRWNYPMVGKLGTSNASGFMKGGPAYLDFFFTKKSIFSKDWVKGSTMAINIKTSNGIVHIMEAIHPFGFGKYNEAVTEPYDNSLYRPAGVSTPWELPSVIGQSTLVEAEDFDLGGQYIAYYDDPSTNGGKNYRPSDVDTDILTNGKGKTDVGGTYGDSYSIGWTKAGEWLNYSIYAPVEGDYVITSRVGNGNNTTPLKFHYDLDLKNVTGSLTFVKGPGGWHDWRAVQSPTIHITQGNHVLRFFHETNDVQFNNFTIKRVN